MSPLDMLAIALRAVRGHGRRSGLTLLGVAIGVAAVLVLTALGEGARRYVQGEFAELGSDLLGIVPGKTETTGGIPGLTGGVPNDLTIADAQALQRALPHAAHVVPIALGSAEAARHERSRDVVVIGSTPGFLPLRDMRLRAGRSLPDQPWDRGAAVCLLGTDIARELFPGENALGELVKVGGWRLRVVGILAPKGVHLGMDLDEIVCVPVATAMAMFDTSSLFRIGVRLASGADMDVAEQRVLALLVERHGEEDVTIITQDAVVGALGGILDTLTIVLAGIAAVSLAVAGIGVMNVMLVSVSERTSEVGLIKAVGAAPRQILAMFLVESMALSAAGGVLGLGLGYALIGTLRIAWPGFPAHAPGWAVAASLGVSLLVGTVFGVLPARQAARLDPVLALSK